MFNWNNIEEMFEVLHKINFEYIILRNYEEIDEENFYISGHADIDFLVKDGYKFAKVIHAYPRFIKDDGIHYIVNIGGEKIIVDARSVGDGYYDTKWEKMMLKNRKMFDNRFYVADDENYYYSLIYHAILQKKVLTNDYLQRLNKMASALDIAATTEQKHLSALECFMKTYGFYYTVPYDIHVPLRKDLIDQSMIKKYTGIYIRDIKIKLMQAGSKIKHVVFRK